MTERLNKNACSTIDLSAHRNAQMGIYMTGISLFEVIGPNMIGPSSSHTAGAVSMALLAQKMFQEKIQCVDFTLYGSFAQTYRGHGTDRALLGGILGFETDDIRIRDAFQLAEERGLEYSFSLSHEKNSVENDVHPNTADMLLKGVSGKELFVRGVSLGGGKVKITRLNQIEVDFTGEYSTLIVSHSDRPGVAAYITKCLSDYNVNIAFMRLYREAKYAEAFSILESDEKISKEVVACIKENPYVSDVMLVQV